jgi:predicted nuclease of predicted toxin-antitoxin system
MKILLDENIPTKVKFDFGEGYEIFTVRDMNWLGKKNGEL